MQKKHTTDKENRNPKNGDGSSLNINPDENISKPDQVNEPVAQENEIDSLKAELELCKDKYIRQVAEFDNFRKRNAKEKMELMQTAGKEIIRSLLDILDDADRAEKQIQQSDDTNAIKEGVLLVFQKLRNVLYSKGLKPMLSVGENFNPDRHEAISEVPVPADELKGKVIDEVQKGYYLNDKIIRFSQVVVGK